MTNDERSPREGVLIPDRDNVLAAGDYRDQFVIPLNRFAT